MHENIRPEIAVQLSIVNVINYVDILSVLHVYQLYCWRILFLP